MVPPPPHPDTARPKTGRAHHGMQHNHESLFKGRALESTLTRHFAHLRAALRLQAGHLRRRKSDRAAALLLAAVWLASVAGVDWALRSVASTSGPTPAAAPAVFAFGVASLLAASWHLVWMSLAWLSVRPQLSGRTRDELAGLVSRWGGSAAKRVLRAGSVGAATTASLALTIPASFAADAGADSDLLWAQTSPEAAVSAPADLDLGLAALAPGLPADPPPAEAFPPPAEAAPETPAENLAEELAVPVESPALAQEKTSEAPTEAPSPEPPAPSPTPASPADTSTKTMQTTRSAVTAGSAVTAAGSPAQRSGVAQKTADGKVRADHGRVGGAGMVPLRSLMAKLPARAPAATPARAPQTTGKPAPAPAALPEYEVQPGDSLWSIAAVHLEKINQVTDDGQVEAFWQEIYLENQEKVGADPELIYAGTKLTMPST